MKKGKRRKEWKKKYAKKRKKEDINFKIRCNLASRIHKVIKRNQKSGHTIELLACSVEELRKHLENKFQEGMTWENYGKYWEIDHIKPCCSFDLSKPEEQHKCFNYKNLQPLTITENRRKNGRF